MRPLYLEMTAIGPFLERTVIDFSQIGATDLFLIHGPTGAGKTFILDAMCYSLYGRTPSHRQTHIQSDFAGADVCPRILFVFQLGDAVYRAERSLAYMRTRKRGDGSPVQEPESACLSRLSAWPEGKAEVLETRKSNVDRRCSEILGLDIDQFSQVILLPQGEFRKLLLAPTTEREELLSRLFHSDLYEQVQIELNSARRQKQQLAEQGLHDVERELENSRGVIPDTLLPTGEKVTKEVVAQALKLLEGQIRTVDEEVKSTSARAEKCLGTLSQGEALLKQFVEKERLDSLAAALESEGKEIIEALKQEMQADEAAAKVMPHIDRLQQCEAGILRTTRELSVIRQDHDQASGSLTQAVAKAKDIPRLESQRDVIRNTMARVQPLVSVAKAIAEGSSALVEKSRFRDAQKAAVHELTASSEKIKEQVKQDQRELEALASGAQDLVRLKEDLRDARSLAEATEEQMALEGVLSGQTANVKNLELKRQSEAKRLTALRTEREKGLAGELAAALKDGAACPVCGSTKHPVPAKRTATEASLETIQETEAGLEHAGTLLRSASLERERTAARLESIQTAIASLRASRPDWPESPTHIAKLLTACEGSLQRENDRQAKIKILTTKVQTARDKRLPEMDEQVRTAEKEHNEACRQCDLLSAKIREFEKRIANELTPDDRRRLPPAATLDQQLGKLISTLRQEETSLPMQIQSLQKVAQEAKARVDELSGRLKEKQGHAKELESTRISLAQVLDRAIVESPFATAEAVTKAVRDDVWRTDARSKISVYNERLAETRTRKTDLDRILKDRARPDLDVIRSDYQAARSAADAVLRKSASTKDAFSQLDRTIQRIAGIEKNTGELLRDLELLGKLDDQVRGQGTPKISLERFFLAQRLEEVLIQASRRLAVLSRNRFVLRRDATVRHGAAQTGLDLSVFDSHTGTERPASTLSGGQVFLASLALALGLADVVQARAGGINLEALFVDEGFGSLDEDALQVALQVLNELRAGRMVGVISHVTELRRQIGTRIEVQEGDLGSRVRIQTAA